MRILNHKNAISAFDVFMSYVGIPEFIDFGIITEESSCEFYKHILKFYTDTYLKFVEDVEEHTINPLKVALFNQYCKSKYIP